MPSDYINCEFFTFTWEPLRTCSICHVVMKTFSDLVPGSFLYWHLYQNACGFSGFPWILEILESLNIRKKSMALKFLKIDIWFKFIYFVQE